jgi:hypothetical protein
MELSTYRQIEEIAVSLRPRKLFSFHIVQVYHSVQGTTSIVVELPLERHAHGLRLYGFCFAMFGYRE